MSSDRTIPSGGVWVQSGPDTNFCFIFCYFGPEAGPHRTCIADSHLKGNVLDLLGIHLNLDTPLKETPEVPRDVQVYHQPVMTDPLV